MLTFEYLHTNPGGIQVPDDTWVKWIMMHAHSPEGGTLKTHINIPLPLLKKWGERDYRYFDRWFGDLYETTKDQIDERGLWTPDPRA